MKGISVLIFPTKSSWLFFLNLGGILIISISLSFRKSSIVFSSSSLERVGESVIKKGSILESSKTEIFSIEVVEPFTENPFSIKSFAKGNPNQPQPRMLIFVIFILSKIVLICESAVKLVLF